MNYVSFPSVFVSNSCLPYCTCLALLFYLQRTDVRYAFVKMESDLAARKSRNIFFSDECPDMVFPCPVMNQAGPLLLLSSTLHNGTLVKQHSRKFHSKKSDS